MATTDNYDVYRGPKERCQSASDGVLSMRSSLPGIGVVCDGGEPAPCGRRRPYARRMAPKYARSSGEYEHLRGVCERERA